ncbi:MAG TPA: DUF1338 family protein, partial [Mycobacterium sp.]|nr:DUF1338 family protein [Mycobacterium sp.]
FRDEAGRVYTDSLRVRFGEVESRGVALTPRGRDLYDAMLAEVDARLDEHPGLPRQDVAAEVWSARLPATDRDLAVADLAYYTFSAAPEVPSGLRPESDLAGLIDAGWVIPQPIIYEDFLPRSAAGIFQSNLSSAGHKDTSMYGRELDIDWMSDIVGIQVADPSDLYAAQRAASLHRVTAGLDLPGFEAAGPASV